MSKFAFYFCVCQELENYRNAMGKMTEDILALRSQVANLEEENSRLRAGVSLHRNLLDDTDIDVMTKTEIADRIVSLKFMLAAESRKVMEQTDKIQQLQNELIRKNDSEKELVELQRAHQQQQAELQHYQGHARKLARLEGTICQQEKVPDSTVLKKEIESVLAAENSRLRKELERLRCQPSPVPTQQPAQVDPVRHILNTSTISNTQTHIHNRERMNLLAQLERTEACIHTLNKQLEENARQWGREKQGMLIRLSEYGHGFTRTSSEILHDLPQVSIVSDSIVGHVRHRHLKPLKRLNTTSQ
uniref:Coiled-coil domain containing 33 n=1 Tax=Electrophorus electricus TaxID=8005 RepID=A0A4W4DUL2_ELEEL